MSGIKTTTVTVNSRPRAGSDESNPFKSPRTPRFAEATSVYSPIDPPKPRAFPVLRTNHFQPQPQLGDLEKGPQVSVEMDEVPAHEASGQNAITPASPLMSPPLKSALKTPGTSRNMNAMFSPTFREEEELEKREAHTDIEQQRDLKIKTRVRMAKLMLRGVNFSCSLIVLSMMSSCFAIFNATKVLPKRNNLPAWAPQQQIWPQILVLCISSISLAICILIFYGYWKGGHNRAAKVAVYYTAFSIGIFVFSTAMWVVGAAVLQTSKTQGKGKDFWGWSCAENQRKDFFQEEVHYALVCRLQSWSLVCCLIEVVVELIVISIYGVVFYRVYTKRKLRKSMANRDRARSDLYLAQLRSQSAPNTPGFNGPMSAREGGYKPTFDHYVADMKGQGQGEAGEGHHFVDSPLMGTQAKPFVLQPAPVRAGATPRMQETGFTPIPLEHRVSPVSPPTPPSPAPVQQHQEHFGAAPGEQVYDTVPIPGGYADVNSPTHPPQHLGYPRS